MHPGQAAVRDPSSLFKIAWKGWMGLAKQLGQVNSVLMGEEGFGSVAVHAA